MLSKMAMADGVVNAISLYVEHGGDTFHSVHVEAAARIAKVARRAGVKRLVHLSGIGADAASRSPYIRDRGEGEAVVQAAFAAGFERITAMTGPENEAALHVLEKLDFAREGEADFEGRRYAFFVRSSAP